MKLPALSVLTAVLLTTLVACDNESSLTSEANAIILDDGSPLGTVPPLGAVVASGYYFSPASAMSNADAVGSRMAALFDTVTGTLIEEYETQTATTFFSDDTATISKRIANKAGCDSGLIDSTLEFNGTLITGGSMSYVGCVIAGVMLHGDIGFTAESTVYGEILSLSLTSLKARKGSVESVYDGDVEVSFIGDEVELSTDSLVVMTNGVEEVWTQTRLSGRLATDGERTLDGSARLASYQSNESVFIELHSVVVSAGETVPSSGTQVLTHSDTSKLELMYSSDNASVLHYATSRLDDSHNFSSIPWEELKTRVRLP